MKCIKSTFFQRHFKTFFKTWFWRKNILYKVLHIIKKSFNQQCTGHPTNSNEITISVILKFIWCSSTILFTSKFAFKRVLNTYTMNIDLLKVEKYNLLINGLPKFRLAHENVVTYVVTNRHVLIRICECELCELNYFMFLSWQYHITISNLLHTLGINTFISRLFFLYFTTQIRNQN